ncbi:MAG: hypothetical protein AAGA09_00320 [Pseudomonadota bacterium]
MRIFLSAFFACAFVFGNAAAAPVTKNLSFFDEYGDFFGFGSFTYDIDDVIDLDDLCDAACRFVNPDTDFPNFLPLANIQTDFGFDIGGPLGLGASGGRIGGMVTLCPAGSRFCPTTPQIIFGWEGGGPAPFFMRNGEWGGLTNSGFAGGTFQVSAVPLPAAAWLFIAGAGLLGWRSRRKTRV